MCAWLMKVRVDGIDRLSAIGAFGIGAATAGSRVDEEREFLKVTGIV